MAWAGGRVAQVLPASSKEKLSLLIPFDPHKHFMNLLSLFPFHQRKHRLRDNMQSAQCHLFTIIVHFKQGTWFICEHKLVN